MGETSNWTVRHHGSVALLTYRRPPGNLIDPESLWDLNTILDELAAQTGRVKVVVLTGGLDRFFINHGDVSGDPQMLKIGPDGRLKSPKFPEYLNAFHRIEEMPQPTIAAIDGLAAGGGSELALACTLRLGSPRARLQQPEVAAGVIPGGGATVRLPRLVGPAIAAEAILTGRIFEADEALHVGWLNAILPADGFVDRVLRWTDSITQHSSSAINAATESLRQSARLPRADAIRREQAIHLEQIATTDFVIRVK
jgi:enoyl-CoA hydratase